MLEITFIEKPGTGIFLIKEHAKLYKPHKKRETFALGKRLSDGDQLMAEEEKKDGEGNKRKNLGGGQMSIV
jgi:hypothetical protein